MRMICIDSRPRGRVSLSNAVLLTLLEEGREYEVEPSSDPSGKYVRVPALRHPENGATLCFYASRFAPSKRRELFERLANPTPSEERGISLYDMQTLISIPSLGWKR